MKIKYLFYGWNFLVFRWIEHETGIWEGREALAAEFWWTNLSGGVISGLCRGVNEIFALLECYAAEIGSYIYTDVSGQYIGPTPSERSRISRKVSTEKIKREVEEATCSAHHFPLGWIT